jgi:predicted RND superfamily exporter protein
LESYLRALLRHRTTFVAALAVSLAVAGWSATRVKVRFSVRDFYDYPGNPDVKVVDGYHKDFGDPGGFVFVLVQADDVFARPVLQYIEGLTHDLEPDKTFSRVISLVNAKAIYADGDAVNVGALLQPIPADQAGIERARKAATASQLLRRRLVAPDSRTTAVLAEMRTPVAQASIEEQRQAVEAVERVIAKRPPPAGVTVRVTGAPTIEVEGSRLLLVDQLVFFPVAVVIMLIALFLTFRTWHGVLLPFGAVLTALGWTLGIFPAFGRPVDMISSAIPATLLVYGAVDPIFVLSRFLQKLESGLNREEALIQAYRELGLPCFLTSLTTALGFFSFATMKLPTIVNFGWVVGIGVSLAWVTTMTVLPLLLGSLPVPKQRALKNNMSLWIDARIHAFWDWTRARIKPMLAATALVCGLGAWASTHQVVSISHVGLLPPGGVREAIEHMEKNLTGVLRTAIVIEGPEGSMKRPEVLKAIARIDETAMKNPNVESTVSLSSLVAEVNQAFNGGDVKERRIPDSKALIAQYLSMLGPDERSDYVDSTYSKTHIRILSVDKGSAIWRPMAAELRAAIDRELKPLGITATITGFAGVIVPTLDSMVDEMIIGFIVGFLVIVAFEWLLFRSLRIALISVVPNALAALACFVVLSILGISLRIGTTLFLSVSIGGLFNTTIHIAARARQRLAEGETDPDVVLDHSLRKVGPPAFYTAAILSAGFGVFLLSRFPDLRTFGVLSVTVLMTGFFCDLIVTPVLMRVFYDWPKAEAQPQPEVAANVQPAP